MALAAACKRVVVAEDLFEEMRSKGVVPNVITHISLIKAFGMADEVEKALQVLKDIKSELSSADMRTQQNAYQVAMTACMRVGDYGRTREVFMEMLSAGIAADASHYTTLMASCSYHSHGDIARTIFDQMCSAGMKPDVTHYMILISCNRHNLEQCSQIMSEMKSHGIEPSGLTYQEFI